MTGPICQWCGGYLRALDDHDEDECYRDHQAAVYERGAAQARAALAEARHTTTEEATT